MNNIPTFYNGIRFRSRLEAKWAAFFDYLRWPWEYEPVDLNGWIPDFILPFPHAPIAVEVKPVLVFEELKQYTSKLEASGWDKEMLVVGARLFKSQTFRNSAIGLLGERIPAKFLDPCDSVYCWSHGCFILCFECRNLAFMHDNCTYCCRYCGHHNSGKSTDAFYPDMSPAWSKVTNKIQWKPPK